MKPIKGMKEEPGFVYNDLMAGGFVGCVRWALGDEKTRKAFEKETGLSFAFLHNRTGFEKLIDQQTGREGELFARFSDWVTVNIWGREEDIEEIPKSKSSTKRIAVQKGVGK